MNDFKTKIVDILISGKILNKDDFITYFKDSKFIKLINEINNIAPVKMIIKNKNDQEISLIFDEICSEVEKIDLDNEINILENKMIKQMDEKTFEELLSLKNKIKSG
jgi:poly(A) polymerase Pap1